jgi:hypothetical protein
MKCPFCLNPIIDSNMDIQFGAWLWEGRAFDELLIGYVLAVILDKLQNSWKTKRLSNR